MHPLSPPARAVLLLGAELGIEFEEVVVDLLNLEHRKSEFVKVGKTRKTTSSHLFQTQNLI